ncbi:MAG TPA: lysophospholipid acyltransferase family protein [Thermodesulfobacteriota bacterium]|nr:lysophospholipid acyltransferase family protein [Thermodesulfobacteriota bacterium]
MARKRLLFRLGYFYLNLIGFFGHLLPRRIMLWMAVLMGNLYWLVMKNDRDMVRRNLSRILEDPTQVNQTARRTFVRYAKYLVDYTRMDLLNEKHLRSIVHGFEGREHIDRAISQGKGGLILTAHLGNWEMGGIFLTLLGYSLTVITAPDVEPRLQDYRLRLRQEQKIKVITLDDTLASSLAVLKALQANDLVALLGDRDLFSKGIPVNFAGQKVFFPVGPALLGYLSDAALIPTFVLMDRDDKYRCLADPPIILQKTGNRNEDIAANTQRIATVLERFVRLYPDQWYTFYDYFLRHKA